MVSAAASQQFHRKTYRATIPPLWIGLLSLLLVAIFTPVILNMLRSGNDYPAHIYSAYVWEQTGYFDRPRPQFLFHAAIVGIHRLLPGSSIDMAAAVLGIACYVTVGVTLFSLMFASLKGWSYRGKLLFALTTTLILMLAGPVNLLTAGNHNLYLGYLSPHIYHNPTITLLKPFALLLFLLVLRVFDGMSISRPLLACCALVTTLGTIAKPNYVIAVLPVLALLAFIAFLRKQSVNWLLLAAGVMLPAVIVLLWQRAYYQATDMGSFIFAPLQVMNAYSPGSLLPKFLLSILFPLCVAFLYIRAAGRDRMMQIAWLGFAVGVLYTYLLAESKDYVDGNFTWSGQITLFILFVASALLLIRENAPLLARRRFTPAFVICTIVLVLHLIGGLALYVANLGADWQNWM